MPSPGSIASMSAMAGRRSPRRSPRRRGARLLSRLCRARHRGLDHAGAHGARARAEEHVQGLFRPRRLRRQRDQHQAGLVLQQHPGPPRQEDHHLALARLSRLRPDDRIAHRAGAVPQEIRPAAGSGDAHRGAVLFPPSRHLDVGGGILRLLRAQARRADPAGRAGHGRRLHRRAGAGHRRHRAAAEGLLGRDPGSPQEIRHPADRR